MPIPKPNDNEEEQDYINRCMGAIGDEYEDNEQAVAVCYQTWRNRNKDNEPKQLSEPAIEHKKVKVQLDDTAPEGSFIAKIATLDVVDLDGDLTERGAFPQGKEVLVSAYMHESWTGKLPVGKATIEEVEDEVIAKGTFNLKMEAGREHYEAVKFSGDLQEWSYGFIPTKAIEDEYEGKPIRRLKTVDPIEISPVLKGAGIRTATVAIKSDNMTYADQSEAVLAAVTEMVFRTKSLADLRMKEGRVLSTANRERMKKLYGMLNEVASDLKELLDATEPRDNDKALEAQAILSKLNLILSEV